MRHFDPDDPIWNEDDERAAARAESYEEWQAEIDAAYEPDEDAEYTYAVVTGFVRDEGTVVVFSTADGRTLAVPHNVAPVLLAALQAEGEVPVAVEAWSVL